MKYQFLLFDMDGMLVDTREGILKCAQYALDAFGIHVDDLQSLTKFVGPPLSTSFREFYGFTEKQAEEAVAVYRQRYSSKGQYECYVFDGVETMLQELKNKGFRMCISTSKLESYAKSMLVRLGIADYFEQIVGATLDEKISAKAEVIAESMRRMQISDPTSVLMIGDRKHDIIGANICGIDSFGVYMGCAESMEHEIAGATYIANSISELHKKLLSL